MIDAHPAFEAPFMKRNFSRVNFGWWGFWEPGALIRGTKTIGVQPDMWEYGTSKAAAWDSPISIQMNLKALDAHPRTDDILEVMRRWEDVRAKKWLTPEQKERIRASRNGFHLYLNEKGGYELCEIEMLPTPTQAKDVRAFLFERNGKRTVAYWHMSGSGRLAVALGGKDEVALDRLRYLETSLPRAEVKAVWAKAVER